VNGVAELRVVLMDSLAVCGGETGPANWSCVLEAGTMGGLCSAVTMLVGLVGLKGGDDMSGDNDR
jgi:hypothetical protein